METLIHFIENELHHIATIVKLIIEAVAISIIVFSTIRTIPKFIRTYKKRDSEVFYHEIRLDLGLSLALSLEFLLAADIVGTAVTPSWEAIGLLAAIAANKPIASQLGVTAVATISAANKNSSDSAKDRPKSNLIS